MLYACMPSARGFVVQHASYCKSSYLNTLTLEDLDIIRLEAGIERREPAQWDELRVWDPGDG